jgi:mannose-6-phosphate isomerase-like protein (cupin superfamily)
LSEIVKKPWGWENRFAITDKYLGKVIHINGGEMLSLQYHRHKDETLLVVKGVMDLQLENDRGQIEVSTPEIDDVVRLEDKYGRQGTSTA